MTKRLTGLVTAFVLLFMQLLVVPAAHAAMVGNDAVVQQMDRAELKAKVMQVMDHKAAAQTLEKYGVDKEQVSQRLDRLTDQELQQLAQKADELPAGQSVLGAILLIILILIILDLLGATNVFPAIHPIS
ncbi:MAG: PA2779 family protein [Alcanivorax sediminis]|uniref:PA2779 family protein n=1 Tax=Alcanivorax sediminis TaxID=2663008 RepID=A0A6N7LT44_9GAMM|nr:PA2779 family protein [Alcanivorax sediminis]MQX53493.1 PA2779 family protein [Alcanivorax sediminis]